MWLINAETEHEVKTKLVAILTVFLSISLPLVGNAHAFYTYVLPSNTLYADDFENYTVGKLIPQGSTAGTPNSGWSWSDNTPGTSGYRAINNTLYYSCCK